MIWVGMAREVTAVHGREPYPPVIRDPDLRPTGTEMAQLECGGLVEHHIDEQRWQAEPGCLAVDRGHQFTGMALPWRGESVHARPMASREGARDERSASVDELGAALERVGLVEVRVEGGRVRYRTTPHGERVRRMLARADRPNAEALLDALLDGSLPASRDERPTRD
jgi:hypothetical protein